MSRANRVVRTVAAAIALASLLLASSCSSSPRVIGNAEAIKEIDTYLAGLAQEGKLSASVLIARRGVVLLDKGYGMADYEKQIANNPTTKHRIGSISKVFTGAGVLKLWEQKKISLEAPINAFIPDFPRGDVITVGHLLSHASGLADLYTEDPTIMDIIDQETSLADLIARFKDKPLKFEPGSSYGYSNSNYVLLAAIIEKVSGKSYGEFIKENIFGPAGMADSGEYVNQALDGLAAAYTLAEGGPPEKTDSFHWSVLRGSDNIYSTTKDLYSWHQSLMKDSVLSKESRLTLGNVLRSYGHVNGVSSGFLRFPSRDTVVIVLGNSNDAVNELCEDLANRVLGQEEVEVSEKQLQTLVGKYEGEGYTFELVAEGQQLFAQSEDGTKTRVVPLSGGDYLIDGLITGFPRDDWGRAAGIVAKDLQEVSGNGIIAVRAKSSS